MVWIVVLPPVDRQYPVFVLQDRQRVNLSTTVRDDMVPTLLPRVGRSGYDLLLIALRAAEPEFFRALEWMKREWQKRPLQR